MYSALCTLLHMYHFSKRYDEVACAVKVVKYYHSVHLLGNHPNFYLLTRNLTSEGFIPVPDKPLPWPRGKLNQCKYRIFRPITRTPNFSTFLLKNR